MARIRADGNIGAGSGLIKRGRDEIHQTVHRIGTIKRRTRPAYNFNRAIGLRHGIHQRVDIGKARRAHRNTVFEIEERTGTRAAHQNGRAHGGQMFLAAAAMNMHTRGLVKQFDRKQINGFGRVERGDVARIVDAQAIAARGGDDNLIYHSRLRQCRCAKQQAC